VKDGEHGIPSIHKGRDGRRYNILSLISLKEEDPFER
jgi:hypothetical protein